MCGILIKTEYEEQLKVRSSVTLPSTLHKFLQEGFIFMDAASSKPPLSLRANAVSKVSEPFKVSLIILHLHVWVKRIQIHAPPILDHVVDLYHVTTRMNGLEYEPLLNHEWKYGSIHRINVKGGMLQIFNIFRNSRILLHFLLSAWTLRQGVVVSLRKWEGKDWVLKVRPHVDEGRKRNNSLRGTQPLVQKTRRPEKLWRPHTFLFRIFNIALKIYFSRVLRKETVITYIWQLLLKKESVRESYS